MSIRYNQNQSFCKNNFLKNSLNSLRSKITIFLIAIAFFVLLLRAFWIQVANKGFYTQEGNRRVQRTIEIPAARGSILDRRGAILAMSQRSASVFADPVEAGGQLSAKEIKSLSKLLKINYERLCLKLKRDSSFVYLARQKSYEIGEKIASLHLPGIYRMLEWQRVYPLGECVSHIVGFAGSDGKGQEGIELSMNSLLSAKNGQRMIVRDRMGRVIEDLGLLMAPVPGKDITLTIDSRLQHLVFSKLKEAVFRHKAKAASALIIHAKTGEILALANWPAYDPNKHEARRGEALRNRAVTDLFEPGSTIKPLNVALAIDVDKVSPSTVIDTSGGKLAIGGGYTIKDVSVTGHLSVENVVKKSSNVGMVRIMSKISPEQMWESFRRFGLGQAPSLNFPGVASGWLMPANRWKPIEQASMSYGYGLSVSLLQMAQAYTVFAGSGNLLSVSLLKCQEVKDKPVIRATTAKKMRRILELSASPRSYVSGYRVAGKSGTTRKVTSGKYERRRFLSHYIGFLPSSNPEIIIAVVIDDPTTGGYYGSLVAAPVFSEIGKTSMQLLEIKPDMPVEKLRLTLFNNTIRELAFSLHD